MKKSNLAIILLLLFSFFQNFFVLEVTASSAPVVYVSNTEVAGWYNETQVATITEAFGNVSNSGTIYIWDGHYNESVGINKSISIIGNSSSSVFITYPDNCTNMTVDYVNLSGVHINATDYEGHAFYAYDADYFNFTDVNISNERSDRIRSIYFSNCDNFEIYNSTIDFIYYNRNRMWYCSNFNITYSNFGGARVYDLSHSNFSFNYNMTCFYTSSSYKSDNLTFNNNTFLNYGSDYSINMGGSKNITVTDNYFINYINESAFAEMPIIDLEEAESMDFSNNSMNGCFLLSITEIDNCLIANNTFDSNASGIIAEDLNVIGEDNVFNDNLVGGYPFIFIRNNNTYDRTGGTVGQLLIYNVDDVNIDNLNITALTPYLPIHTEGCNNVSFSNMSWVVDSKNFVVDCFNIVDSYNITFDNVNVTGISTEEVSALAFSMISANVDYNATVKNCMANVENDIGYDPINIEGDESVSYIIFENNTFNWSGGNDYTVEISHFANGSICFNDISLGSDSANLYLYRVDWADIHNNTFWEGWEGIRLFDCENLTFHSNYIIDNDDDGVRIQSGCENLTFYNNYFSNGNEDIDEGSGTHTYNISKTLGTNILGGAYLGGNHWEGYVGEDTDWDGLGNTLTPFTGGGMITGGDYLPLQQPLTVIYVDDNREDVWYNETQVATITEAIVNITSAGNGTIYVNDGQYTEDVAVNKSVTIIGNGTTSTLTATGYHQKYKAMTITADNVSLFSMNFTNCSSFIDMPQSNNSNFSHNTFYMASGGYAYADFNDSDNVSFYNNTFIRTRTEIANRNVTFDSNRVFYSAITFLDKAEGYMNNITIKNNLVDIYNISNFGFSFVHDGNTNYYGDILIESNTIRNTTTGEGQGGIGFLIYDDPVNNVDIYNNTFTNHVIGLVLSHSNEPDLKNFTLIGNNFTGCEYVLDIWGVTDFTAYNNYFEGEHFFDWYMYGNNMTWNTTKKLGTNIYGGAYLGGNYWYNYTGEDTDYDGLGDTLTPFNGGFNFTGDYHPLVAFVSQVGVNVFNESNPAQAIGFDLLISNENGSQTYESLGCSNTFWIPTESLPYGDNTIFVIRNDSYFQPRTYYKDLNLGETFNYSFYLPPLETQQNGTGQDEQTLTSRVDYFDVTDTGSNQDCDLYYTPDTITAVYKYTVTSDTHTLYSDNVYISDYTSDTNVTLSHPQSDIYAVYIYNFTYGGWIPVSSDNYTAYSQYVIINSSVQDANSTQARVDYYSPDDYGYEWLAVANSHYYLLDNDTVRVNSSALDANTTMLRVQYLYWTDIGGTIDTELYMFQVVDESNRALADAKIIVKKYINTTESYEEVGSVLTGGGGLATMYLVPQTLYKVFTSKSLYEQSIDDLITDPEFYGASYPYTIQLAKTATNFSNASAFWETIIFNGYINATGTIFVNYTDISQNTISTNIHITENVTLDHFHWDNRTFNNSFQLVVAGGNTSRDYQIIIHIHHYRYGENTVPLIFFLSGAILLTNDTFLDTLFDANFGGSPAGIGWANCFGFLILIAGVFAFGQRNTGVSLVITGGILLFINAVIGFTGAGITVPILFIVAGVGIQWGKHRRGMR